MVTILFVCEANLCRSPMAERLARLDAPSVHAHSAGTHALAGGAMDPRAAAVLAEVGADITGFVTRRVDERLLGQADLVLTATRAQRADCVSQRPDTVGRTLPVLQFGRLAAALTAAERTAVRAVAPARRANMLLESLARARSDVSPVTDADDLADPVHGTLADLRACRGRLRTALGPALTMLADD